MWEEWRGHAVTHLVQILRGMRQSSSAVRSPDDRSPPPGPSPRAPAHGGISDAQVAHGKGPQSLPYLLWAVLHQICSYPKPVPVSRLHHVLLADMPFFSNKSRTDDPLVPACPTRGPQPARGPRHVRRLS